MQIARTDIAYQNSTYVFVRKHKEICSPSLKYKYK